MQNDFSLNLIDLNLDLAQPTVQTSFEHLVVRSQDTARNLIFHFVPVFLGRLFKLQVAANLQNLINPRINLLLLLL